MNIRVYHELIYRQKIFFKDVCNIGSQKKKGIPYEQVEPIYLELVTKTLILPIVIVEGARMG